MKEGVSPVGKFIYSDRKSDNLQDDMCKSIKQCKHFTQVEEELEKSKISKYYIYTGYTVYTVKKCMNYYTVVTEWVFICFFCLMMNKLLLSVRLVRRL